MIQLVYASRPLGFDAAILSCILVQARAFNAKHDLTGALICRNDLYLQLIEGPQDTVTSLYERIKQDDRHANIIELVRRPVQFRLFPAWAMRDDPVQSWMWSREDVAAGRVENAGVDEVLAVFVRLANKKPTVVTQTVPE
ncbi:Sensors of blue-light using FAD [Cognatiyoonia koreensis]|uniref:Sensors of blue-light using FAD n=1 Tax=Cognatiyoonia koreensis TaxID=364200 RepID=A0A1I0N7B0_9RHOB|nr:BLUF domain-containing protein [Cognatiyoonia koreensis]SEV96548.1 Sensors of blue-light using FAD [Cognatiyoonia koreensis]